MNTQESRSKLVPSWVECSPLLTALRQEYCTVPLVDRVATEPSDKKLAAGTLLLVSRADSAEAVATCFSTASVTVNRQQHQRVYWYGNQIPLTHSSCATRVIYTSSLEWTSSFILSALPFLSQFTSHPLVNSSLSSSPLSSSITPSLFHSKLKTYLFNKSFPP